MGARPYTSPSRLNDTGAARRGSSSRAVGHGIPGARWSLCGRHGSGTRKYIDRTLMLRMLVVAISVLIVGLG